MTNTFTDDEVAEMLKLSQELRIQSFNVMPDGKLTAAIAMKRAAEIIEQTVLKSKVREEVVAELKAKSQKF